MGWAAPGEHVWCGNGVLCGRVGDEGEAEGGEEEDERG